MGSELEHHRGAEAFVVALINHAQHQFLNEGVRREFRADATDDPGPEVLHPGAARLWKTRQKDMALIKLGDQKVTGERANFLTSCSPGCAIVSDMCKGDFPSTAEASRAKISDRRAPFS